MVFSKPIVKMSLSGLLLVTVSQVSFAKEMMSSFGLGLLLGGGYFNHEKQAQVFFPESAFRTDYFRAENTNMGFSYAISLSYQDQLVLGKLPLGSILKGLTLSSTFYHDQGITTGSVYEYSLPDFNNSTYQMDSSSNRFMLEMEYRLHTLSNSISPFLEVGLGLSQNQLSFQNIPRPDIGADGGYYKLSHSVTHFAYELGGGLKLPVTEHINLSIRYIFTNVGSADSGIRDDRNGVLLNKSISSNPSLQSVLLGFSYLFG